MKLFKSLRLPSAALAAAMLLSSLFVLPASAEGASDDTPAKSPAITLSTTDKATPGSTVNVTVTASDFEEVFGVDLLINTPEAVTLASSDVKTNWENDTYEVDNNYTLEVKDHAIHLVATGAVNVNTPVPFVTTIGTNELLSFSFTVPEDAVAGETSYAFSFANDTKVRFCTSSEAEVAVATSPLTVTVESAEYKDSNLKIRGAGITMANGFALDFKVRKTMETSLGYSDVYLVFQKPRYNSDGSISETLTTTVYATERTEDSSNSENYIYTLNNVQPQELATVVTATIYGTKDGKVYTGATVEYSVLQFAVSQLNKGTNQALYADMINYAKAVQDYSEYNTANPIDAAATAALGNDSWKNYATSDITRDLVNAQTNTAFENQTVRVRSAGVILDSKVALYFNCADLGVTTLANPEKYKLHVTYNSVYGDSNEFDLTIGSNYQGILDTLYTTELGTVVTAYIVDGSGNQISNKVTYSIETYISKNLNDAKQGGWCTALLKFGDSVRAYAGLS